MLIDWLQETAAAAAAATPAGAADGPPPQSQPLALLLQQQLALLRLSGGYSIAGALQRCCAGYGGHVAATARAAPPPVTLPSRCRLLRLAARDLRSLLQLLRPGPDGSQQPTAPALLDALTAMAAHDGPACFFSFSPGGGSDGGSRGGPSTQVHGHAQPSGVVCSPSLGGGSGAGGPASRFVSLPRAGFSFAAWVCLEDGREAADALMLQPPATEWAEHSAGTAALASDQAIFSLLHQHQPAGTHGFLPHHSHSAEQLLQGVALAVRCTAGSSAGSPRSPYSLGGGPRMLLVAHSWAPKHSEAVLELQQPLTGGRWHHIALAHSAGELPQGGAR